MSSVTVNTAATLILSTNTQRQSLILENYGPETVFLGSGTDVTTLNGISLLADGILTEDDGGTRMYMGAYYGITTTNITSIRVWERNR